ncbi:MAG: FAD-dependent oxidoreductase [Chloroflexota bacterium]
MPRRPGTAIVLGGGPAGMTTGLALSRAGWVVEVFEKAPIVGGLARTELRDGFRFDIGGHRWFTKKDELNYFLVELLGDELLMVDRTSRIFFDGKYVDYPLRIGNVLTRIGPVTSVRAAGDFLISMAAQRVSRKEIASMEDAYVAQFGQTLYELFFRRYSEKVWGRLCSELSGDWVAQRSRGLSLFTAVRDAIRPTEGKVESLVERFMYPRLGYGRITERMAQEIEAAGGKVHLGEQAIRARHDGAEITGITVSDGARERTVDGDAFVSSIPMTELAQILDPSVDRSVQSAIRTLTYRDLITVNVMLDRQQVTNDTWIYVHDPTVKFARLHEPRNWSPDMVPEGKTSLVLEYFCDAGDPLWQRSDADLCALAVEELAKKLHFITPNEVIGAFALRSRDAYPRYNLGYQDAVGTIKNCLRSFHNLSIVGRGGTFKYFNADHAIETGLLAARGILGESVNLDDVNKEQEYLEERRVPTRQASAALRLGARSGEDTTTC